MRIAVLGSGAIGSYYGGMLARAGNDVTFIARGEHLAALRADGLMVQRDLERFVVHPVQATDDPAEVGPVQLVLLATKAYDLDSALAALGPLLGRATLVLPLLNGMDVAGLVAARLPGAQVLAGLTYVPANRPRPGAVHQPGPERRLVFGEREGPATERCRRVLAVLLGAGIKAEMSDEMPRELWSKLMLVVANGGVCGAAGSPIGPVLADADTRALYLACCREVAAVACACGVALDESAVRATLDHAEGTPVDNRPSMLQDLEAGRPLELEHLHGALVRLAREHGVPVPVNAAIYAALKLRANGRPG
jgi:2-dehydropantoate 2-reductase